MMRTYVINLESAVARREAISRRLTALSLPFEICAAVDGRRLDAAGLAAVYDAPRAAHAYRPMTAGEVGCALSHVAVYERFLSTDAQWALVMEDDAALSDTVPTVLGLLEPGLQRLYPEVVLLSHVDKYTRWGRQPLDATHALVQPYKYWWRAHGYLINRAAAQRLVAELMPVWTAADSWKTFADAGWIRLRAVVPYCIGLSELAAGSSLEAERAPLDVTDKKQSRSVGWYVKRYVYERCLHQLFIRPFLRVAKQKMTW